MDKLRINRGGTPEIGLHKNSCNERFCYLLKLASFLTLICAAFIVVAACTSNAYDFLYHQHVNFKLNLSPSFSDLLIVSDFRLTSHFFLIQKLGHMAAFGLLFTLLFLWIRKAGIAFVCCGLFAVGTEILQLYFGRNGRLYDMGIDMLGVCLAFAVCRLLAGKMVWEERNVTVK